MDYDKACDLNLYVHSTSPVSHFEPANKTPVPIEGTLRENIALGIYTAHTQTILLMKGLHEGVDIIIGQDFLLKHKVWVGEQQMLIKHRKRDYHYPSSFFTTSTPVTAPLKRPITVNTLVRHVKIMADYVWRGSNVIRKVTCR